MKPSIAACMRVARWLRLALTDGNLGAQLRRLEDAGYLALRRDFVERKPVTWYALSKPGRKALGTHLSALRAVIGSEM